MISQAFGLIIIDLINPFIAFFTYDFYSYLRWYVRDMPQGTIILESWYHSRREAEGIIPG